MSRSASGFERRPAAARSAASWRNLPPHNPPMQRTEADAAPRGVLHPRARRRALVRADTGRPMSGRTIRPVYMRTSTCLCPTCPRRGRMRQGEARLEVGVFGRLAGRRRALATRLSPRERHHSANLFWGGVARARPRCGSGGPGCSLTIRPAAPTGPGRLVARPTVPASAADNRSLRGPPLAHR